MQIKTKPTSRSIQKITLCFCTGLILLLGSVTTYQLFINARQDNRQKLNSALEDSANITINNIQSRLNAIVIIMRGIKAFIDGSDIVEPDEFHAYVKSLNLNDKFGVRAIARVEIINSSNKESHVAEMKSAGFSDYKIKPEGVRARYAPIVLIEPLDALNIKALGLDVFTLPPIAKALEQSVDTNEMRISSIMTLAQDAGKKNQRSFVMYLPIYQKNIPLNTVDAKRKAITGWVDVPFRMNDLIEGLKGEIDADVDISIYQDTTTTEESLLYSSLVKVKNETDLSNGIFTQRTLEIGGSKWSAYFHPTPAFEARAVSSAKPILIALLGATLTILSAFLAWFLLTGRQRAENRYQKLFDQAGDGVLVLNYQHQFISANLAAVNLFGYQSNTLLTMQLPDVLVSNIVDHPAFITNLLSDKTTIDEWECRNSNGAQFTAEVNCKQLDKSHYFLIIRDLTEKKLAEHRIKYLTQLYQALSEVNQAIVRMGDDNELFPVVCRCAVNFGGMKMAWIGQLDDESQFILPVAVHGDGIDFVDGLVVSADASIKEGRGPAGIALRENQTIIIHDFLTDPRTSLWHEGAKTFGWGSSVSLPIQRNQQPFAVLNVYHQSTDAFDNEAIALLKEMAGDISFALDNFDREAKKQSLIAELNIAHKQINQIVNLSPAIIYTLKVSTTNSTQLDFISENVYKITGHTKETWGQDNFWINHVHPDDLASVQKSQETLFKTGALSHHYRFNHADGSYIWFEDHLMLSYNERGQPIEMIGACLDITDRLSAEEKLRINAKVFESSRDGILITDENNIIISVNRAFANITGYEADDAIGHSPNILASHHSTSSHYDAMWEMVGTIGYWQGEIVNRRKNGELYTQWLSISTIKDSGGRVTHHIGIITDISEKKVAEERIQFLSNFDALTNLPNKNLLTDRTTLALASAARTKTATTLMFLDLDRFKFLNESLGPTIGDLVIKELAERLVNCVSAEDTVCRQGGDEFILLLPSADAEDATHLAEELLRVISQPFQFNDQRIVLTTSIGIAVYPQDGESFEQLAQSADIALYRAKHEGRNNFQFFAQQMHAQAQDTLQLESELRSAIEHQEFLLYYQPQYNSKTSKITGLEALIRWQHPEKGLISPATFIPIAEESGLIVDIGDWVLRSAVKQQAAWQKAGLDTVPVAVNLSVVQFQQDTLYASVCDTLKEANVNPNMLELELTEGIAMKDSERTLAVLNQLNALGVRLSIDDFGTGYSSLSYLKKFKIDKLKIDQSFVRGLGEHPQDEAIIKATINMAKGLGFKTIAEGVETLEQLNFLIANDCDEIQGYYFSKPLPTDEISALLAHQSI